MSALGVLCLLSAKFRLEFISSLVLVTEDAVRSVHDSCDGDTGQETTDIDNIIERHGWGTSSIVLGTCISDTSFSNGGLPLGP